MSIKEMLKSSATMTTGNLGAAAVNFVTFVYLLNALGLAGYGLYTLATAVVSFFTLFIDLGLGKVVVSDASRYIKENEARASGMFRGFSAMQILAGFAGGVALIAFTPIFSTYFGKDLSAIIMPIGALVFLAGLGNIYATAFETAAQFRTYSAYNFFDALIKLALLFVGLQIFGNEASIALGALAISEVLLMVGFWPFFPKKIKSLLGAGGKIGVFVQAVRTHGKWVAIFTQARNLESNLIYWIIEFFLGVKAVGVFSALWKVVNTIIRIFEPLETVFYPIVGRAGGKLESRKAVFRTAKYMLYASVPVIAFGFAAADYLLPLVLGPEIAPYANSFRILLLVTFVAIINTPMRPLFFGLQEQRSLIYTSVMLLAASFITGSIGAMYFGMAGICAGRTIVLLLDVFNKNYYLNKITGERLGIEALVLPDRHDVKIFSIYAKKLLTRAK